MIHTTKRLILIPALGLFCVLAAPVLADPYPTEWDNCVVLEVNRKDHALRVNKFPNKFFQITKKTAITIPGKTGSGYQNLAHIVPGDVLFMSVQRHQPTVLREVRKHAKRR